MTQTIWITYGSAGSLVAGGLERVTVWFHEPVWNEVQCIDDIKEYMMRSPFTREDTREGLGEIYSTSFWGPNRFLNGVDTQRHSFGKLYGYDSELSEFVWSKLCQHFRTDDLRSWPDAKVSPKAFCLIIELDIPTFKLKKQIL